VFICTSRRTKTETADFVTAALRFETAVASLLRCPGIDHVHSLFITDWRCFCTYWLWGFFFSGIHKGAFRLCSYIAAIQHLPSSLARALHAKQKSFLLFTTKRRDSPHSFCS